MNRRSTECQVWILFHHQFTIIFAFMWFWGDLQATSLRCFGSHQIGLPPWRPVLWASSPARSRAVTQPCCPTRPARCMSGFWIRKIGLAAIFFVRISEQLSRTVVVVPNEAKHCSRAFGEHSNQRRDQLHADLIVCPLCVKLA